MPELRTPGVYFETEQPRFPSLSLIETGVVGFLGLATRGPLDRPVKISSFKEFQDYFGTAAPGSFLSHAVEGFFENGGRKCYVLRVAHARKPGARNEGGDYAEKATLFLVDEQLEASLEFTSVDEGIWGNSVSIDMERNKGYSTLLTMDADASTDEVVVKRVGPLAKGSIIRFDDGEKHEFATIAEVHGKSIRLVGPLQGSFKSWAPTSLTEVQFDLNVSYGNTRERYKNLTMSSGSQLYVVRVVNDNSRLVRVRDLHSPTPLPGNFPRATEKTYLLNGIDGVENVHPGDFIGYDEGPGQRRGVWAFGDVDEVDVVVAPDLMPAAERSSGFNSEADIVSVQEAMVSFCENTRECFALLDFPRDTVIADALEWRRRFDTSFAAFYYPWLFIDDAPSLGANGQNGRTLVVPPSGHVAGLFSKCDQKFGVYKVAANERIEGVYDIMVQCNEEDQAILNEAGINVVRAFQGPRGIRVWGARTLSSDIQWRYINVRRIFILLRKILSLGTQWVVFEPNSHTLWKTLNRVISTFLSELWVKGYFTGATAEQAFYVKCDKETNPQEDRDKGMLTVEVGVAPVRPAEFVVFRISHRMEVQGSATPGD